MINLCATKFIFCNNSKPNRKILLAFCRGDQGDANKTRHPCSLIYKLESWSLEEAAIQKVRRV